MKTTLGSSLQETGCFCIFASHKIEWFLTGSLKKSMKIHFSKNYAVLKVYRKSHTEKISNNGRRKTQSPTPLYVLTNEKVYNSYRNGKLRMQWQKVYAILQLEMGLGWPSPAQIDWALGWARTKPIPWGWVWAKFFRPMADLDQPSPNWLGLGLGQDQTHSLGMGLGRPGPAQIDRALGWAKPKPISSCYFVWNTISYRRASWGQDCLL